MSKIHHWDCIELLKKVWENTVDLVLTDPPYNFEFLNHKRSHDEVKRRTERVKNSKTLVKHIPYGSGLSWWVRNKRRYEKNYNNIIEYWEWCEERWKECFRTLKPWWIILVFNSSRTVSHVQVALEKCWFYARDILVWRRHSWIPKWVNFEKKMEKMWHENPSRYRWRHSCLRQEWEWVVVLQKPLINNYHTTVLEYWVWLFKAESWDISWFQGNIFEWYKRDKKDEYNSHCTIKPIKLIEDLIEMCVPLENERVVLDPFMGSWTTAVACRNLWVSYLWYEINKEYYEICEKRLKNIGNTKWLLSKEKVLTS